LDREVGFLFPEDSRPIVTVLKRLPCVMSRRCSAMGLAGLNMFLGELAAEFGCEIESASFQQNSSSS
jgi:hypothetical protein